LIELLVVMAVIAVLASFLMPALQRAKARASTVICLGNLHQLGMAAATYAVDAGRLPSFLEWLYGLAPEAEGDLTTGRLYPYLKTKKVYLCPTHPATVTNPGWAPGPMQFQADHSYAVNCMTCHAHDITDCRAPARTVYLVEEANLPTSRWGSIAEPDPAQFGTNLPVSVPAFPHSGRTGLLMMDGHVAGLTAAEFRIEKAAKEFWYPTDATDRSGTP
jgi:prepilin-type processing-associated H-X9-DG protein